MLSWWHKRKEDHLAPIAEEMRKRGLDPDKDEVPDDLYPWALRLEMKSRGLL